MNPIDQLLLTLGKYAADLEVAKNEITVRQARIEELEARIVELEQALSAAAPASASADA